MGLDDGARSIHEADCPPFEPGTSLDRRFTAEHVYRNSGEYRVRVTLRHASRLLAVASVTVGLH